MLNFVVYNNRKTTYKKHYFKIAYDMKNLYFLFATVILFSFSKEINAQCTGCTTTSNAANGNFTVASGDKLCLTRNGGFSGSITLTGNAQLCVSSNTTVTSGATLTVNGNGNSIENFGTWNEDLNLGGGNSFTNNGAFSVGSMTIGNSSSFTSTTDVTVTGSVNNQNGGSITVNGTFSAQSYSGDNNSTLTVTGDLNITSNITNNGNINVSGSASVANVNNNGNGSIIFGPGTTITGTVLNSGDMQFNGNATIGGSFTNNGGSELIVNDGVVSVGGAFNNNGDITALGSCGRINIAGSSVNNGGGDVGMDGSNVDICDQSSSNGGDFDANNGNTGPNVTNCTCNPTILPITLSEFSININQENIIQIEWQTIWELNNDYFEIERSFTGEDFATIGKIQSQKDTKKNYQTRFYSFQDPLENIDNNLVISTIYYRLKQTDTNGDFTYSPVKHLNISPDFFQNKNIEWSFKANKWIIQTLEPVNVKIYTTTGKLIGKYKLLPNKNTINVSRFAKGIYILKIEQTKTGKHSTLKVVR